MGIISDLLKYRAFKKGVEAVKHVFIRKAKPVKRNPSTRRKTALRKATARA
jgi:hypothetical protein